MSEVFFIYHKYSCIDYKWVYTLIPFNKDSSISGSEKLLPFKFLNDVKSLSVIYNFFFILKNK